MFVIYLCSTDQLCRLIFATICVCVLFFQCDGSGCNTYDVNYIIIIIIIHEFHGDTSLKQNFRSVVNVTYWVSVNAAVATSVRCRTICETVPSSMHA